MHFDIEACTYSDGTGPAAGTDDETLLIAALQPLDERGRVESLTPLVHAAAGGDALAWERLVHYFSGLVRSVTRSHRLREADAADVAQTVWLRLYEHVSRIKEPESLGGWLVTVTRNECL